MGMIDMLNFDLKKSTLAASAIMIIVLGICLASQIANWVLFGVFAALELYLLYDMFVKKKDSVVVKVKK